MENQVHVNNCRIFRSEMADAIQSLNDRVGLDSIHSNFLKMGGQELYLPLFQNCCRRCWFTLMFPSKCFGEIKPVIKNEKGSKTDSSNWDVVKDFQKQTFPKPK